MSFLMPLTFLAMVGAEPNSKPGPDLVGFIVESVTHGLARDNCPQDLVAKLAARDDDFVPKCLLCKATREALFVYSKGCATPPGAIFDAEKSKKLASNDAAVRRAALRDLISGYIDQGFASSKMSASERTALQKELSAQRELSMGIKSKDIEFCPSCDGVCCHALPDETVPFGLAVGGVQSRLSLVTARPQVGQPLRVRLELKNVGSVPIRYDSQQAEVNGSLSVTGPDGKPAPYIATSFQTMGSAKNIQPGDTKTIFSTFNVTEQYLLEKPGKYAIKFVGRGGIPESNLLAVEVAAGKLSDMDWVLVAMRDIAPNGWRAVRYGDSISFLNTPTRLKADAVSVTVYFTKDKNSGNEQLQVQPKYLGEFRMGHAWLQTSADANDRWPDHDKTIEEKLKGFKKFQW